jgi:hypothetical protein
MPTTRTTMERDKHLPSPEVCDWLLSLQWKDPVTVHRMSPNGPVTFHDYCEASRSIARGEEVNLLLRTSARKALRKDRDARAAAKQNQPAPSLAGPAPVPSEDADDETGVDALSKLTNDLLRVIHDADSSVPLSVAALETAKMLFISQVYDLRQQPEE